VAPEAPRIAERWCGGIFLSEVTLSVPSPLQRRSGAVFPQGAPPPRLGEAGPRKGASCAAEWGRKAHGREGVERRGAEAEVGDAAAVGDGSERGRRR